MQYSLDNDMITHIVEQYSDMLMRIAYQYTHSMEESKDIMQDTFLALLDKRIFLSEEHIKHWLIRVVINKSKNYLKSAARKTVPLDETNLLFTPQERETITELDQLGDLDRNIIYLHYYEGYSLKEVSKILKITQNTVYIRVTRARQKLKNLIEDGEKE